LRTGVASESPALIDSLPAEGLPAAWISEQIPAGGNGGWGSPVVADGRVYLFAHFQTPKPGVTLPPPKYPGLKEEEQKALSKEDLEAYEQKRQAEDRERRKASQDVKETIFCFDAETGKTLWKNEKVSVFTGFSHSGTPAVVDGTLYILAPGGIARAVDTDAGENVWSTQLPGEHGEQYHMSSFAVVDGVAVVLAGRLFALDTESGSILWEGDPSKSSGSHSSPVVWESGDERFIIANVAGGETVCISPKDGQELWRVKSEANLSTPLVIGDRLLTFGDSRKKGLRCFQLSQTEAKHLWTFQGAADKGSSPVVVDGHAYVQGEKRLACVNLETGKAVWKSEMDLNNPQYSSLAAADGKIFYTYGKIICFRADPEDYQEVAVARLNREGLMATDETFRQLLKLDGLESAQADQKLEEQTAGQGALECASPAIAGGRLYIRLNRGVACYDLRAKTGTETKLSDAD
jgi:outer membrane protein assembly factor BamB